MGSFNFKQAPYYKEKSCQFIGQTSKNILPLPALQGDIGVDITQLPISKNITKIEGKLAFPLSSLGLLRAKHPQSNKVIDGTCALIAPKLLLTCAHNLYSYKQKMHYSEVEYFPSRNGIESTKIRIKITEQRVRIHPNFIEYETSQHEHFDYAIIMLEQSLEDACGCMEVAVNYKIKEQDDIYLFGYPVEENNIKHEVNLYGAKGNIKKITQNIILYDMQTAAGQSGAPLFIQHQGKWKIIGIHTISDPSGIYINTNVANTINSWINQQESALVVEDGSKIFGQKWPKLQKMVRKYTWESLVELTFNGCNITSQNLAHLNKLNWNIRILTLDHNKIDSICLDPAKFRPLQKLSLNNNVITRLDGSINGFQRLAILSLRTRCIMKKITASVKSMQSLHQKQSKQCYMVINASLGRKSIRVTSNFDSNYFIFLVMIRHSIYIIQIEQFYILGCIIYEQSHYLQGISFIFPFLSIDIKYHYKIIIKISISSAKVVFGQKERSKQKKGAINCCFC